MTFDELGGSDLALLGIFVVLDSGLVSTPRRMAAMAAARRTVPNTQRTMQRQEHLDNREDFPS